MLNLNFKIIIDLYIENFYRILNKEYGNFKTDKLLYTRICLFFDISTAIGVDKVAFFDANRTPTSGSLL
jgi:hypothetical protein